MRNLMTSLWCRALRGERGASAVEYALLITGIAAVIVIIVFTFGDNVNDLFDDTCEAVRTQTNSGSCV